MSFVFREFKCTILSARCKLGMLQRVSWTESQASRPLCLKSTLCPNALHHLARRPDEARSGLDLSLYLSRKPSYCPILLLFLASSSRHSVNFITKQVSSKFVDVWHEDFRSFLLVSVSVAIILSAGNVDKNNVLDDGAHEDRATP